MNQVYVVTEGQLDVQLLKRLLPVELAKNVVFVAGGGISDAQSLARSILAVRHRPVALVLDADTVDPDSIKERELINQELLQYAAAGAPFKILLAVPTIESILFQDRSGLEQLTKHKFTDVEWAQAEFVPKTVLQKVLSQPGQSQKLDELIQGITERMVARLRQHPLVRELEAFLVEVSAMLPVA